MKHSIIRRHHQPRTWLWGASPSCSCFTMKRMSTCPDCGFAVDSDIARADRVLLSCASSRHWHSLCAFLLLKYLQRTAAHSNYSNTRQGWRCYQALFERCAWDLPAGLTGECCVRMANVSIYFASQTCCFLKQHSEDLHNTCSVYHVLIFTLFAIMVHR